MAHDEIAEGQDESLWDVLLDADVGRLRAELVGIDVRPHRHDDVDRELPQSSEHARDEVTRLDVEHGAEREVDRRRVAAEG